MGSIKESPVSVIVRGLLEKALCPQILDELFERSAKTQYTRGLLFSTVVNKIRLVVCGVHPAVHPAHQASAEEIGVSVTSVYNKINGIEPSLNGELVGFCCSVKVQVLTVFSIIENWYEVQRNLSLQVARDFILEHLKQKVGLNAYDQFSVNAYKSGGILAQPICGKYVMQFTIIKQIDFFTIRLFYYKILHAFPHIPFKVFCHSLRLRYTKIR